MEIMKTKQEKKSKSEINKQRIVSLLTNDDHKEETWLYIDYSWEGFEHVN